MADNFTANAGSGGDTFASDDIGSVQYPRGKISLGADGSAADALGGAGAVAAGVQRVTLASDDPAVVDLAAIEVLQTTIAGDTTSIDGKITACNTGAVVLAAGTAEIGKLAAGTAGIGKLTANSGVDIGDVTLNNTSVIGPGDPTIDSYATAVINFGIAVDNEVVAAPGANKQIWVYGYSIVAGTADGTSALFEDEDNTALSGVMVFAQYGGAGAANSGNFAMPIFKVATNKALDLNVGGGEVDGWLSYAIVSV